MPEKLAKDLKPDDWIVINGVRYRVSSVDRFMCSVVVVYDNGCVEKATLHFAASDTVETAYVVNFDKVVMPAIRGGGYGTS